MYTAWEGDLRDWLIVDELDETISLEMKMMMVFLWPIAQRDFLSLQDLLSVIHSFSPWR